MFGASAAGPFGGGGAFGGGGNPVTPPSLTTNSAAPAFGSAPATPFGTPAASGSVFGGPPAQSSAGLFGAPASGGGLFGAPAASSGGLFGAPASSGGLFGAPASSGGLFGAHASSGGLFGAPASSGGLFGASSGGGLFGASTGGGLFGAQSGGGLFGANTGGGLFGGGAASSGGLFGASTGGGLFGGGAASSGGLFGTPSTGGLFGAQSSGGMFGVPAPAQGGLFGAQQAQPQAAPQMPQLIMGKDGQPITCRTPFENLPDQMQQFLKTTEQKVSQVRHNQAALRNELKHRAATKEQAALHELAQQVSTELAAAKAVLGEDARACDSFKEKVMTLMRSLEQQAFLLSVNKARRDVLAAKNQQHRQQLLAENAELLHQSTTLPSPFLPRSIDGFIEQVALLRSSLASLEVLIPSEHAVGASLGDSGLHMLPSVMRSLHEYFVHVAANVAVLHSSMQSLRKTYLARRVAMGDFFDPFEDAERRDAEREAAAEKLPALKAALPRPGNAQPAASSPAPATIGASAPAFAPATPTSAPPLTLGQTSYNTPGSSGRPVVKAKRR